MFFECYLLRGNEPLQGADHPILSQGSEPLRLLPPQVGHNLKPPWVRSKTGRPGIGGSSLDGAGQLARRLALSTARLQSLPRLCGGIEVRPPLLPFADVP